MAGLTGKTIAATYESLLKVSTTDNENLVADTQKDIVDGLDNVSALKLATNRATITLGETTDDNFLITNSSTASNILVVEGDASSNTGRVGIGTATPGAKFEIEQGASDGATAFLIDNNDTNQIAMSIEAANIDADVIDITADAVTTVNVIDITADGLTSGKVLNITSTGTLTGSIIDITADSATTGKGINVSMDALTTGNMLYLDDNSASTSVRNCVSIIQNNDAALDATALLVQSDAGGTGMKIDKNYPAALVAADTITGLHVDFDHTVPSSGTATQTDIGIDLDVNSATLGTSTTYGMDIDVVGATSGTHTVVGLAVDVGSADTNYAALFNGGNVGIGAVSPGEHLEVAGAGEQWIKVASTDDAKVGFEMQADSDGDYATGKIWTDYTSASQGTMNFSKPDGGGENIAMTIKSTGGTAADFGVGIGTTAPASPLHIEQASGDADGIRISSNGIIANYGALRVDSGGRLTISSDAGGASGVSYLSFAVDGWTKRMHLDIQRNLGIDNAGTAAFNNGYACIGLLNGTAPGGACTDTAGLYTSGGDLYGFADDGNATALAAAACDERTKDNIAVIPDALSRLANVKGVTFNYVSFKDSTLPFKDKIQDSQEYAPYKNWGDDTRVGVIAQGVEVAYDGLGITNSVRNKVLTAEDTGENPEKYGEIKQVEIDSLVPLLIEAVKELSAKVEALENT